MPVPQGLVGIGLVLRFPQPPGRLHGGRRVGVVEQRGGAGEPLVPHQLLGVDPPVRLPESDVPLAGNLAQSVVDRHSRCS